MQQHHFLLWMVFLLWPSSSGFAAQTSSSSTPAGQEQELRRAVSRALNSLGVFYHRRQESPKAIETLEEALKYEPESAEIRTNLAMMYLEQQQFQKVVEQLTPISQ